MGHPGRKDRKNDLNTPLSRSIQAIGRMRLSSGKPSTHPERIPSKKITMQADNIDTEPTATNTKTTPPPTTATTTNTTGTTTTSGALITQIMIPTTTIPTTNATTNTTTTTTYT